MRYEHKSRDGQRFIIYALVCPRTLLVRYVGQTSTTLEQRRRNHTTTQFHGAMRAWLEGLNSERPIAIVLEEGVNRKIPMRSDCVWYATVRETVWQKRFHRTLFNETPLESPEAAALLCNPPLPWESGTR